MSEVAPADEDRPQRLVLGRIAGLFGVRGWVKVFSETEPREGILRYSPWLIGSSDRPLRVLEGRVHGKGVVARIEGCDDREQAATLVNQEIAVTRDRLPPPRPDEFYWIDLEGLAVETLDGVQARAGESPVRHRVQRCPGRRRRSGAVAALRLERRDPVGRFRSAADSGRLGSRFLTDLDPGSGALTYTDGRHAFRCGDLTPGPVSSPAGSGRHRPGADPGDRGAPLAGTRGTTPAMSIARSMTAPTAAVPGW